MAHFDLPYAKTRLPLDLPDARVKAVLTSAAEDYVPAAGQSELVAQALQNPSASPGISELARGKKHVLLITSDHTRPVPSRITMPPYLAAIRQYNPDVRITILIATGMHRPTTQEELIAKLGEDIVAHEEIVIHDAYRDEDMTFKGILPSGGELWLNKLVDECDFICSEGFIEPHFFAGFSGGRKSILPGIASRKTVLWNHNARFIANKMARAGNLAGNPIHEDMFFAAKAAGLAFILNVVINSDKEIIAAFAGDLEEAHRTGCELVSKMAQVAPVPADLVITTNGGYPLDQNLYQTVKGMTAAEACVNEGGVIIIASSCADGSGGDFFYHLLADAPSGAAAYQALNDVAPADTEFDQWEAQILARILTRCRVIVVSTDADKAMIRAMHMECVDTLAEAIALADRWLGREVPITVIPDGIAVIVR